jgi:hypothetical protein
VMSLEKSPMAVSLCFLTLVGEASDERWSLVVARSP